MKSHAHANMIAFEQTPVKRMYRNEGHLKVKQQQNRGHSKKIRQNKTPFQSKIKQDLYTS